MQIPEPTAEHRWLHSMIGEWTYEMNCSMGPDQPPMHTLGKASVRSIGGFWVLNEGTDPHGTSIMTLGYDPKLGRFIGTFIASMMTFMWHYEGSLDPTGSILTLDTEGPNMSGDGSMVAFQDIFTRISEDERTLASQYRGPDGQWVPFMLVTYRRVASAGGSS